MREEGTQFVYSKIFVECAQSVAGMNGKRKTNSYDDWWPKQKSNRFKSYINPDAARFTSGLNDNRYSELL